MAQQGDVRTDAPLYPHMADARKLAPEQLAELREKAPVRFGNTEIIDRLYAHIRALAEQLAAEKQAREKVEAGRNLARKLYAETAQDRAKLYRRLAALEAENVRLRRACKEARRIYDHFSLSPLAAAAKYGPDYEPPTREEYLEMRKGLDDALTAQEPDRA